MYVQVKLQGSLTNNMILVEILKLIYLLQIHLIMNGMANV